VLVCWFGDVTVEEVRVALTEVALTQSEFDSYQVTEDASLTFCLKELRVRYGVEEVGQAM